MRCVPPPHDLHAVVKQSDSAAGPDGETEARDPFGLACTAIPHFATRKNMKSDISGKIFNCDHFI